MKRKIGHEESQVLSENGRSTFSFSADEEEGETDFEPESTLNPYLQRLYRCLSHRALRPDAPLPAFKEEEQDPRRGLSLVPR